MKILSLPSLILSLLIGCTPTRDCVEIVYLPSPIEQKIDRAENVTISVTVNDLRRNSVSVGCKSRYGVEYASVVAKNDIPELVRSAIQSELTERGFQIGYGQKQITIEIAKFDNNFKLGLFSGCADSEIIWTVTICDRRGAITYTKTYLGYGIDKASYVISCDRDASLSLNSALSDIVQKTLSDAAFINALLH